MNAYASPSPLPPPIKGGGNGYASSIYEVPRLWQGWGEGYVNLFLAFVLIPTLLKSFTCKLVPLTLEERGSLNEPVWASFHKYIYFY
jgi:hypothetical protein